MTTHRESDDDYDQIVTRINDRWRVIVCRDGLQWILQKREGKRGGKARWTGVSYSTTRKALITATHAHCCDRQTGAMECLKGLPNNIEDVANG